MAAVKCGEFSDYTLFACKKLQMQLAELILAAHTIMLQFIAHCVDVLLLALQH